ncbi:EamA family transporter [Psychromonas sp.]|uniref:EamA family transporter n=1 Tax=Psychromonas sp. TaxID=1884585 RepID=UPI003569366B
MAITAATLSYAFAGVYGRRFKKMAINPIIIAAGQVSASTLLLIPIALTVDGAIDAAISLQTWAAVVGLAVFSTAIAYVLYFKILNLAGATNVLLVTLSVPVSAILLGSVFLNKPLEVIHFVGISLIELGLSAIDGRLWMRVKSARY